MEASELPASSSPPAGCVFVWLTPDFFVGVKAFAASVAALSGVTVGGVFGTNKIFALLMRYPWVRGKTYCFLGLCKGIQNRRIKHQDGMD